MLKKLHLLFSKKRRFTTNVKIITILHFLTKILNLGKQVIIANVFGFSLILDIFNYAFAIITTPINIIFNGIISGVIPFLKRKSTDYEQKKFIFSLFFLINLGLLLLGICFHFCSDYAYTLFNETVISGQKDFNLLKTLCLLLLFGNLFYLFLQLMEGYYCANERFLISETNFFLLSILNFFLVLFILNKSNILLLGYFNIISGGVVCLINGVYLFKKFKLKDIVLFSNDNWQLLKFAFPLILSSSVGIANNLIDKTFAIYLPTGSLTILTYSFLMIFNLRVILTIGYVTPLCALIADQIAKTKQIENMQMILSQKIKKIIFHITLLYVLAFLAFLLVGELFLKLTFFKNESADISSLYEVIIIYFPYTIFSPIGIICLRTFYAYKKSTLPSIISIITLIINIVLNIIFIKTLGIYGLAFATVLASGINCLLLYFFIRKKYHLNFISPYLILVILFTFIFEIAFIAKKIMY